MVVTTFQKGNKYAFSKGHSTHNKGQRSSTETVSVKVLRNRTTAYGQKAKSRKSSSYRKKTVSKDASPSSNYSFRKRGSFQNQEKSQLNPVKTKK